MKTRLAFLLGSAIAATGAAGVASAATATANFDVTITVNPLCDVSTVAPTNLAFASPTSFTADIDQTSTITVRCTSGLPYNVGINAGAGTGSTVTTRKMTGLTTTSATIGYNLYRDSGRTQNWGNTPGTDTLAQTANGNAQALTVYGRVPAASLTPAPIAQSYKDTVSVTVTY